MTDLNRKPGIVDKIIACHTALDAARIPYAFGGAIALAHHTPKPARDERHRRKCVQVVEESKAGVHGVHGACPLSPLDRWRCFFGETRAPRAAVVGRDSGRSVLRLRADSRLRGAAHSANAVSASVVVALHHLWPGSGRFVGFVLSAVWIWTVVNPSGHVILYSALPVSVLATIVLLPTAAVVLGP